MTGVHETDLAQVHIGSLLFYAASAALALAASNIFASLARTAPRRQDGS